MTLLGEEKISLASSGEVGDAVACVEESWALVGGELGVGTESERLVVAEAALEVLVKRLHAFGNTQLTSRRGTGFASHPPGQSSCRHGARPRCR